MLRRSLIAAAVLVAAGVFGRPALAAAPPQRPAMPLSVTSAHFKVWFDPDASQPDYITQSDATFLAGEAEYALDTETGWGYQPPADDGDGKIDIYVVDLSGFDGMAGVAIPDGSSVPSSGSIDIAQSIIDSDWEQHTIAHELFHLIQFSYWLPPTIHDHWLLEGQAEWAGYKVDGYFDAAEELGPSGLPLDCFDPTGYQACSPDGYVNGGYSRWWFYEYLAQKFGDNFGISVLQQAQSQGGALSGLTAALTAKGTTLTQVFDDFSTREVTGGWGLDEIDATAPLALGPVVTGTETADLGTIAISVDHLSSAIVAYERGDGDGDHACFKATLALTVTIPSGITSQPVFYWPATGSTPVTMSISGQTATATLPWDTCLWANAGYLSLPNTSTTADGAVFLVNAKVTVDTSSPAASSSMPTQLPIYGGQTNVASAAIPPAITLFSTVKLKVSSASPVLHLLVESSSDGKLDASLNGTELGTAALRAGNNAVAFTVPKALLTALRRSTAAGGVLTLTSVSPSGVVKGAVVTRKVVIAVTPKPKPKAKRKPKQKQ